MQEQAPVQHVTAEVPSAADGEVLDRLSGSLLAAGHPHAALGCLRKALAIYQQLDDPRVAEVREHIAEIAGQLSSPAPAGKDR